MYFGTWAFDRIGKLPTISWVQGPPGTDSRSIKRQAKLLRQLEGSIRYFLLRIFAAYRDTAGRPPLKNSDAVICGSAWASDDLRPLLSPSVQIHALPYPIDLDCFTPADTQLSKPLVLWAGRSVPRKRLDLFLNACAQLLDAGHDFDVRVVGGFSFAPGYRRLIEEFRHPHRLNYSASMPREKMPELYRQATVLAQPSEDENFGSAVAEALSCGTCVVVGPSNGTADYVGDAGFKFCQYDASAVATSIREAMDAHQLNSAELSKCARAVAEASFDVRTIVSKLEHLMLSTMSAQSQLHHHFASSTPIVETDILPSKSRAVVWSKES